MRATSASRVVLERLRDKGAHALATDHRDWLELRQQRLEFPLLKLDARTLLALRRRGWVERRPHAPPYYGKYIVYEITRAGLAALPRPYRRVALEDIA